MAERAQTETAVDIAVEVLQERDRQDAKWGQQNHPDGTGPQELVLFDGGEFLDDTSQAQHLAVQFTARTDRRAKAGTVAWLDILLEEVFEALAEDDPAKIRTELIQVAAVAQQWVEAIDRRRMDEVHESRAARRG